MPAGKLDLTIEQGATFSKLLTWKDSAGVAVDLTGYTARMQIREVKSNATSVISLVSPTDITLGGVAGTILIKITSTITTAITWTTAVYDLELIDGVGEVTRLVEGGVSVSFEVTR